MRKIYIFLKNKLYYTVILRYGLQSSFPIYILIFLNLKSLKFTNSIEVVGSLSSIVLIVVMVIFPIWIFIWLTKNQDSLEVMNFKRQF